MTKDQFIAAALEGKLLAVVEWRGATAKYFANQADGQKTAPRIQIVHKAEMGENGEQIQISEKMAVPEGVDPKRFADSYNENPKPFKRGERVVWVVDSWGWRGEGKGMKRTASGSIQPFNEPLGVAAAKATVSPPVTK